MVFTRSFNVLLIALAGIIGACATASKEAAPPPAKPPWPRSHVGFERIPIPGATARIDAHHERTRPFARERLVMPTVPPEFLAAAPARATVAVRITVGSDGRVSSVTPSPLARSDAGPWLDLLLGRIREATSRWRFQPATERTLADGPDRDGDGNPDWTTVVDSRPISVFFDAVFTFEAENGHGEVSYRAGSP